MFKRLKYKITIWALVRATLFIYRHGGRVFLPKTKSQWIEVCTSEVYAILKKNDKK